MLATRDKHALIWGSTLIIFGLLGLIDNLVGISLWLWIGGFALIGAGSLIIYLIDPAERWPLAPAYGGLVLAAFISAIELELLADPWIAPVIISLVGLPFLIVYLLNRSQWWALIPAYVLFSVALLVAFEEFNVLTGDLIAPFVLAAIALPFILVFLINRRNWWALIPAYVMISVGVMIALISLNLLSGSLVATYVLLSVALPFFVVYLLDRRQWWALIPGGITGLIGLSILVAAESLLQYLVPIVIILVGLGLIFRVFGKSQQPSASPPAEEQES